MLVVGLVLGLVPGLQAEVAVESLSFQLVALDAEDGSAVLRESDGLRVVRVGELLREGADAPRVLAVQPDRLVLEVTLGGETPRRVEAWVEILRPGEATSRARVVDSRPAAVFGAASPVWVEEPVPVDAPPRP